MQDPLTFHPHPEAWLLTVGLLVGYAWVLRRYGRLFHPRPDDPPVTRWQVVAFVAGVALLWLSSASPLHDIAEQRLFSAHMVQHMLDMFVVPALLLLGIPAWMADLLLRPPWLLRLVRRLSRPLVAMAVFNAALLVLHWPAMVDWSLGSEGIHVGVHAVLILSGIVLWLPVLSPTPKVARISPPAQMGYLFLQTFVPTVPASFLTFGDAPLYAVYETFPRLWGLSALDDMRISGLIMKIGGGFFLWAVITILFFRWASSDEARARGETTPDTAPAASNGR